MFNIFNRKKENNKLFYHTDVHCHILPGVDHGSKSVEQSLAMLQAQLNMGIDRVICTSHVTAGTFENTPQSLGDAYQVLKQAVADANLPVELHYSAEYRLDEYFQQERAAEHLIPMPGNYLLLENSFQQELLGLDELFFELRIKRYHIMMAHPERYSYYSRRRQRYEELHRRGVKFQVNILSLIGFYGDGPRRKAFEMIEKGWVEFLGTDMHNTLYAQALIDASHDRKIIKLMEKHKFLNSQVDSDQVIKTKTI